MSKRCPGSRVATHVCLVVMRALHPAAAAQVAELLVSAAAEFADQRAPAQLAPIGLPVRRGRVALGRVRAALGPGACPAVDVVAGFATAVWLGRPGTDPPALGRLSWRSQSPLDARGRVVLDRRTRLYLAVGDPAAFDVVPLAARCGALFLVPVEDFDRRLAELS